MKDFKKLSEEQEYIKNTQISLFENLNILLENQKNNVDNADLIVQNQSLIIKNQEVIVHNQINIINNQKQIVENQVALSVILQTQAKLLYLMEKMTSDKSETEIMNEVKALFKATKEKQESGQLHSML